MLFRGSEVIESVRDISELSVRIQRLGLNTENQNKNSHTSSENSEKNSEAQSNKSDASHIDIRPVREYLKPIKQASTDKTSQYEQTLRLNSQYVSMAVQKQVYKPFTYEEAMRSLTHCHQWAQVIKKELVSLILNETWKLIKLLKECILITFKWIFKVKYTFNDLIKWFKAYLVIRGFSQQYEIDYKETFAFTLYFDSLCMLLIIAAHKDLHIY